jgi:hypothetical protein
MHRLARWQHWTVVVARKHYVSRHFLLSHWSPGSHDRHALLERWRS